MREFIVETDMDLSGVVEFEGVGQTFKPKGEVIRCRDCKWLDRDITSIGTFLICNAVSNGGTKFYPEDDEWFCPKAERKDDETD